MTNARNYLKPIIGAALVGAVGWLVCRYLLESPDVWEGEGASDDDVQRAIEFRERFHWGLPAKSVGRRNVSPTPRTAVKLGKLEGVIYRTQKKGNKGKVSYIHEFEENIPDLLMDVDNKRLHIAGGSYTVTEDGITG